MEQSFKEIGNKSRVRIGYLVAFALVVIASVSLLVADRQTRKKVVLVDHTNVVLGALQTIVVGVQHIETNARGYYITGKERFVDSIRGQHARVEQTITELQGQTTDNFEQQNLLRAARLTVADKMTLVYGGIAHYKNVGRIDSVLQNIVEASANNMNSLRTTVDAMTSIETQLLKERTESMSRNLTGMKAATIAALLVGLLLIVFGFSTYINENKQRLKALHRIRSYQDTLQHKIDELNRSNEELVRMKSMEKFAATGRIARMIAHEVRNPLTNINLATSELKGELAEDKNGSGMLLEMIDRNSTRINQLIADLLNSTKFAELSLKPVPITEVFKHTLSELEDRVKMGGVTVKTNFKDEGAIVSADQQRLGIAITNILVNAIEAMESSKREKLITISTERRDNKVVASISDSGVGMSEEDCNKIFEPYYSSKQKGNGLGLTNTQNIILNHHGEIEVSSQPMVGTTFTISLPTN